ncbi:MAG: hypothetical protein ACOCZD_01775 [Haloferacaceae archaeon]
MTVPLDDLVRGVHAQLLAASADIDEERGAAPGRSMALTEVDLEVPVGFLAEPVDDSEGVDDDLPEIRVTLDETDGHVSLSFRPRPSPDPGDGEASGGESGSDRRFDRPAAGWPRPSGAARRVGALGRPRSTAPSVVDSGATPEGDEAAGEGDSALGGGSAVEELMALGARPRTARLLARHGPPVEEIASAGVDGLQASLDEALRGGDDEAPTAEAGASGAVVPDIRELSRIVAAAAEREP